MIRDIPVLIVGAGPAGLLLAIEIARRAIPVRIVETRHEPLLASRAKGVQPRTLEILDDLGVADAIIASGGAFPRWRAYDGDRLLWEKSVYELLGRPEVAPSADRPYAATWMIPQWQTESILRRRLALLGVSVEFGMTFESLTHSARGPTAFLRTTDHVEEVLSRYLIGADGARSAVRAAVGIPFPGETKTGEQYIIADVIAETLGREYWLNWSRGGDPVRRISMCPLPNTSYFQLVAPLVPDESLPELSLSTLQRLFEERTGRPGATLTDVRWMTLHRPNVRLAERFRDGRVLLVGDAGHSPPTSPGQGMNISLQDAYNLGWKLAAVIAGASEALLDTYEEERRPIAAGVLGVLAREVAVSADPRDSSRQLQEGIRRDVFNLDHNYRRRSLSRERRANPGAVQAGDRAPDGPIIDAAGRDVRAFDLFRGTHITVLAFNFENDLPWSLRPTRFVAEVKTVHVRGHGSAGRQSLHEIYGVASGVPTLFAIRPDGFVGLCTDRGFSAELGAWLHSVVRIGV